MISTAIWSSRIQAALGREPRSVQEALEGLRQVLKVDGVSKQEFYQAARKGERFERFSRDDRVALMTWAALKEALEKTRKHLGQTPSTLVVRKDDSVKEEVKGVKPIGTWKGPDKVYEVFPWDTKVTLRKGAEINHPQYGKGYVQEVSDRHALVRFKAGSKKLALKAAKGMLVDHYAQAPDHRVADAQGWLERFLSSGEEIRTLSRLEREEEFAGNPHFSEGIISEEVQGYLERAGYRADPHNLEELASLVDSLPTREEKFKEGVLGISMLRTRDGKAFASRKPGLWETKAAPDAGQSFNVMLEAQMAYTVLAEMLQEEGWSVSEVRPHLRKLAKALSPADARRLFDLLQEIAALRLLKVELHSAGFTPVRGVAYRDSSGEVVLTVPVYGH
jgi:hypothetical protein